MIERTPALNQYFGGVMDLSKGLDKSPEKPIDPRAIAFRKALGQKHAEDIRAGHVVGFPLVGPNVMIAACFPVGSTFLLESDLRRGDGTPYKLTATLGPRTDFARGVAEFSIGGKVALDAQRRRDIIVSEIADPTRSSFSIEATVDTLAGTSQLSPVESPGLIHSSSGKLSAGTARHAWGAVLETVDAENEVAQQIASKPVAQRVGLPDTWEDKEVDKPRELMANASVNPKNPKNPVKITNSNIVISAKDRPFKGQGEVWRLVFSKMFLNEAALMNGIIEPLVGDERADEHLLEVAIINADESGKGLELKRIVERTMEVLAT